MPRDLGLYLGRVVAHTPVFDFIIKELHWDILGVNEWTYSVHSYKYVSLILYFNPQFELTGTPGGFKLIKFKAADASEPIGKLSGHSGLLNARAAALNADMILGKTVGSTFTGANQYLPDVLNTRFEQPNSYQFWKNSQPQNPDFPEGPFIGRSTFPMDLFSTGNIKTSDGPRRSFYNRMIDTVRDAGSGRHFIITELDDFLQAELHIVYRVVDFPLSGSAGTYEVWQRRKPRKYGRSATPAWIETWEARKAGLKFKRNSDRVKEAPNALRKTGKRKAKKKGTPIERTRYRLNLLERNRLACSKRLKKVRATLKQYRACNRKKQRAENRLDTAEDRIVRMRQSIYRGKLRRQLARENKRLNSLVRSLRRDAARERKAEAKRRRQAPRRPAPRRRKKRQRLTSRGRASRRRPRR